MNESGKVLITDADIATVEALHDLLIDNHGYRKDFNTLHRARLLTDKMYKALEEPFKIYLIRQEKYDGSAYINKFARSEEEIKIIFSDFAMINSGLI
mgnify:CR=1 FL=1